MTSSTIKNKITKSIDVKSILKSLILLMKPRVISFVIFTCAVGYLTSNLNINTFNAIIGICFVAIGAGASGCLNMWYDSDIDAIMTRTCLRPIPTGKISKNYALAYGIFLSIHWYTCLNLA